MSEMGKKCDRDFRDGRSGSSKRPASRSRSARDLCVNEKTLGNWINPDRERRPERAPPVVARGL